AAALVRDGVLVAAAEEERFRRLKHWAGFPSQAIAYCLREGGVTLSDISHVAVNQDNRANLLRKVAYMATHRPDFRLMVSRLKNRRARRGTRVTAGACDGPLMGRVGPREMSDVSAQKRSKADINQAAFTYRDMSTRPNRLKIDVAVHGRFHAFHLARALSRRGHDVRLLTNYPSSIVERFGFPRSRTATC